MRLAFMGSPEFAVPALRALHDADHEIVVVYCQPPKPAGRGHRTKKSAVHEVADELQIPVRTPATLRKNQKEIDHFKALDLDAAVVAAYGQILPGAMLKAPRLGCLNIHASLLPRWRGAAPIHAAVLAGDSETGITIMQMDEGLDTGPILLAESVPIRTTETTSSLHDRLAELGAQLVLKVLAGHFIPIVQPKQAATYAPKLTRADALIDWNRPAKIIERQVRAFLPWPGTETTLSGTSLKVLAAEFVEGCGSPGTVLDNRLTVACGEGALRLVRVQRAGRGVMPTEEFLRGHPVPPGTRLT